eukprot:533926-Prymnesium_polylepis.1
MQPAHPSSCTLHPARPAAAGERGDCRAGGGACGGGQEEERARRKEARLATCHAPFVAARRW